MIGQLQFAIYLIILNLSEMLLTTAEDPLSPLALLEIKRAEADSLREAIQMVSTRRVACFF